MQQTLKTFDIITWKINPTMLSIIAIFIGGGLGATTRFGISSLFQSFEITSIWSTLASNMIACVVMGISFVFFKYYSQWPIWFANAVFIGFCGGLSTFSTFSNETLLLFQKGEFSIAALNIFLSVILCITTLYIISKANINL